MEIINQSFSVFDRINNLPWPLNWLVWIVVVGGTLGWLGWKMIKFVHQGEVAMIERRGAVRRNKVGEVIYRKCGIHYLNPLFDQLIRVPILDYVYTLDEIRVDYSPLLAIDVKAILTFTVENAFNVKYTVTDFETCIKGACEAELRLAIQHVVQDGIVKQGDDQRIMEVFYEAIQGEAARLGLVLKSLKLSRVARNTDLTKAAAIASLGSNTLALEVLSAT